MRFAPCVFSVENSFSSRTTLGEVEAVVPSGATSWRSTDIPSFMSREEAIGSFSSAASSCQLEATVIILDVFTIVAEKQLGRKIMF